MRRNLHALFNMLNLFTQRETEMGLETMQTTDCSEEITTIATHRHSSQTTAPITLVLVIMAQLLSGEYLPTLLLLSTAFGFISGSVHKYMDISESVHN